MTTEAADYVVPKRTFEQMFARQKRMSDPKAPEAENEELKNLVYLLLIINIAILGFLIGMFASYLIF